MRAAWRSADVRAAEKTLIENLPPGTLMARAAAGLARRCGLTLPKVYASRVLLLAGTGDNGGDALYAGAALAKRGAVVFALLLDPSRAHVDGLAALLRAGGRVVEDFPDKVDLVVDGMLGIGGSGPLRGRALDLVGKLDGLAVRPPVIAVDVPSGVSVDTGDVAGPAVRADITVTFGVLKPALVVGPAVPYAGQVELVDIGLSPAADPALRIAEADDIDQWWPRPDPASTKYTRGVVGVATGSASFPGAALLSTAGAVAGPAGMVRYAGPAYSVVATLHPSVVVTPKVSEAGRVQAWICGSGMSDDQRARDEVRAVLAAPVPIVLDADALTMMVDGTLAPHLRARSAPTVLTPHDSEFKRLAGSEPGEDRLGAALNLAAWTRSVVLLKGDRTVIAAPDGEAWVNPTGTPALATAGSGDVLGGLLGSLLAAGLPPVRAAVVAAYVHGLAGREAALARGAVTASDVAAALPTVAPR
jgi:ADP-dependent NAD(P)H-hydrate dehydratase / NAD(P)H-hydrate epimerase